MERLLRVAGAFLNSTLQLIPVLHVLYLFCGSCWYTRIRLLALMRDCRVGVANVAVGIGRRTTL